MKPDAKIAIGILRSLQETGDFASLAYWTTPNVILTLSGARAFCDGVFWDDDNKGLLEAWSLEIDKSLKILRRNWNLTIADTGVREARPKENYASFDIISEPGLRHAIAQTKLLDSTILDTLLHQTSFEGLMHEMMAGLRIQERFKDFDDEHINHIAFGIQLGYPDAAILASVGDWQDDDPFAEPLIQADIRGAAYYLCPQPVYHYPRSLAANRQIIAHEQSWSGILKDYYTSEFHRSLEANAEFRQKLSEIGNLRP
jgi:hypothetical protein